MRAATAELPPGSTPDYLALAGTVAGDLILRYGFILGLAFGIGWWHRRRAIPRYGVTLARKPVAWHLRLGVVALAVGGLLPRALVLAREYLPIGVGPPHWQLQETWTWEFWLFMAVSSFLIVPIVEELFARGYVQTRLSEDYGAPTAIVVTAFFFSIAHVQYFRAEFVSVAMLVSLLFASLIAGYVRHASGSLLPVIVGHAIGNVPLEGAAEFALLAAMVIVLVVARRAIAEHARRLLDLLRVTDIAAAVTGLAALAALLAVVLAARPLLPLIGGLSLVTALVLEAREKSTRAAAAAR